MQCNANAKYINKDYVITAQMQIKCFLWHEKYFQKLKAGCMCQRSFVNLLKIWLSATTFMFLKVLTYHVNFNQNVTLAPQLLWFFSADLGVLLTTGNATSSPVILNSGRRLFQVADLLTRGASRVASNLYNNVTSGVTSGITGWEKPHIESQSAQYFNNVQLITHNVDGQPNYLCCYI